MPRALQREDAVRTRAVASDDVPMRGRWRATCALSMPLLSAMQSVLRRWQGAGVVVRFDFALQRLWVATEESFCTTMVLCATGVTLEREGPLAPRGPALDVCMRRSLFHDAAADSSARLLLVVEEDGEGKMTANLHIPVGTSRVCSTVLAQRPRAPPRFPFETALLDARGAPVHAHSGAWLCLAVDAQRWGTARAALPASSTTAVFTLHPADDVPRQVAGEGPNTPGRVRIDVRTGTDDQRVVELECAHVGRLGPYEAHPFPTSTIKLLSDSVEPLRVCFGPPLYRADGPYARARGALIAQATPYQDGHESLELAHITHNADIFEEPPERNAADPEARRAHDDATMAERGARLMKRIEMHRRRKRPRAQDDDYEEDNERREDRDDDEDEEE